MNRLRHKAASFTRSVALAVFAFLTSVSATQPSTASADDIEAARVLLPADRERGTLALREAIAKLETQVTAEPGNAHLISRVGMGYFYLEDDARAAAAFDRAIAIDPDRSRYHFMRGVLHRLAGQLPDAERELQLAIKLDSKDIDPLNELGRIHAHLKQFAEAQAVFAKVVELTPESSIARARLASMMMQQDPRSEAAIAELNRAVELDPKNASARFNLGTIYQTRQEWPAAFKALTEAAALTPDDWRTKAKLIQCHQAFGDIAARDRLLEELRGLRKAGKIDTNLFCREQLEVGGKSVIVFESFELLGDKAVRYSFNVVDDRGDIQNRISLGSYDFTTKIARELGEIGPNDRAWHLDGYLPGGEHRAYAHFNAEPAYDAVRDLAIQAIEGKLPVLTSSKAPAKQR